MDACSSSFADPSHILTFRPQSTAEILLITPISKFQSDLKNLRGGDNYALA
jgi:hypothetical protein